MRISFYKKGEGSERTETRYVQSDKSENKKKTIEDAIDAASKSRTKKKFKRGVKKVGKFLVKGQKAGQKAFRGFERKIEKFDKKLTKIRKKRTKKNTKKLTSSRLFGFDAVDREYKREERKPPMGGLLLPSSGSSVGLLGLDNNDNREYKNGQRRKRWWEW